MRIHKSLVVALLWTSLLVMVACGNRASDEADSRGNGGEDGDNGRGLGQSPTEGNGDVSADGRDESVSSAGVTDEERGVMSGDDRSDRLRRLTASWNTDWTRRTVDYGEILSGGPPRDGIPSIDNPEFVSHEDAIPWLSDNEPVVVVDISGDARAYPLQILTRHEIANDTVGDLPVVVTFCPLCNSAIVFERTLNGQAAEFGVSGLLRNSDLIMYDRLTETLWQQFTGEGIVGEKAGEQLTFVPSALISYGEFRAAHPAGRVLSRESAGYPPGSYGTNPYQGYDSASNTQPFLFPEAVDPRLPAVDRVVSVLIGDAAIAYPVDILSEMGVINHAFGGRDLVVFHTFGTASALGAAIISEAEDVGATGVFDAQLDGRVLTFTKEGDVITDVETGSTWNILGRATAGELAGAQLTPIIHGDHFWFSWAAFHPETDVYDFP